MIPSFKCEEIYRSVSCRSVSLRILKSSMKSASSTLNHFSLRCNPWSMVHEDISGFQQLELELQGKALCPAFQQRLPSVLPFQARNEYTAHERDLNGKVPVIDLNCPHMTCNSAKNDSRDHSSLVQARILGCFFPAVTAVTKSRLQWKCGKAKIV